MPAKLNEKQLMSLLRKLEKGWPEGYTLFSWSGTLCLLRDKDLPKEIEIKSNGHYGTKAGSYSDAILETFPGIVNDGGDPD